MEEMRHMPGYTSILKAVLKSQIQHLVDQLAKETQEESLVVTACLDDGTFSHLGSKSGKDFLHDNTEMKTNFLGFCIKKKYRPKSPLTLDADYPPAQSPHPVTLCKVAGQSVVPLEQQKWSYHPQHNLPGKSKISGSQRHVPYKTKGKQKAQTCSYQEQSGMSSSESREDYPLDYVKDNDSNAPSLGETNGDVSIKVERFDDSDEQLDEDTAVDSESDANYNFPAPRNKSASTSATIPAFESESASGPSSDLSPTSGGTNSSVKNHIATKTVSLPPSLDMNPISQESCSLVNQDSNFSIKLETSFDLYDQEASGATAGGLHHTETENTKMQLSTQDSLSTEEKKTEETGPNPEEYLFCKKKNEEDNVGNFLVGQDVNMKSVAPPEDKSDGLGEDLGVNVESGVPLEDSRADLVEDNMIITTTDSTIGSNNISGEKLYSCKLCNQKFTFKGNVKRHIIRKHGGSGKQLMCCFCSKLFLSVPALNEHEDLLHRNQVLRCEFCIKTFRSRNGLMLHKRQHENKFRFMCSHCGKGYQDKKVFEGHVSKHTEKLLFSCQKCSKPFRYSSSMKAHLQVCGVKNGSFACSTCGMLFKRKPYLKEHEEMHNNPERFQCSSCGIGFKYKCSLYKHRKNKCNE